MLDNKTDLMSWEKEIHNKELKLTCINLAISTNSKEDYKIEDIIKDAKIILDFISN